MNPNSDQSLYEQLGVDPSKITVRKIFEKIIDNEYPGAFVNIVTDPFCETRALTMHQDGDGSKFIQRLLHYYESGNPEVFAGMVDDALAMNTGDIAASGFVFGPWIITDVLNVALPKEVKNIVMKAVAARLTELKRLYELYGFNIKFLGGETADLPDQVRSGVFDIGITAWADKDDLIKGNVMAGDVIYGVVSDGRAVWETTDNSGIMSNGLTLARSSLMSAEYNSKYSALRRDNDKFYSGSFRYNEFSVILGPDLSVGEAIISPTRQWPVVISEIISCLKAHNALHMLHGITMNTGGGATKIINLGKGGILFEKFMPTPPPIFRLIQSETKEDWGNMYQSFNCGIGIDIVGENNPVFNEVLQYATQICNLKTYKLGLCRALADSAAPNKVSLSTPYGSWTY